MLDLLDFDYGPLRGLIGSWEGAKGMDISPEPDGVEENPFYETIVFEPAGDVENAETRTLTIVRYHQVVSRKSNDKVFHDQVGYWLWDAEESLVMQTLTIPRAVCVVAGGLYEGDPAAGAVTLQVRAAHDDPDWGVVESPFMRDNARTLAFEHELRLEGDRLSYNELTRLEIYGRAFDHTDTNELTRR